MSIEKVRAYFTPLGIADQIREFTVSSATVELAAVAVGVEGARIAKSLSFKVEDEPIIIVVAGDAKVDNSAYKKQFHTKAKMLTHQEAHELAKSLSFKVEDEPIIIVVAGDAKVDNSAYKKQFHTKAKMLTHQEAHELIGYDVGGVCPFALPENVKTYLDVSLRRFETVFPAAGSDNSAIELTCEDLERYASNFVSWVDVCKGWREEP